MGLWPRYNRDTFVVTGQDVYAWVEVNFTRLGWISIDPSPRDNPIGTRPNAPPASSRSTPLDDPLKNAAKTPPPRPADPVIEDGEPTKASAQPAGGGLVTPLMASTAAALLLFLIAATPTAKAIRRVRRRREQSDRLAVLGAWRETLDRLQEAGVRIGPWQTTGDVVRTGGALAALPTLAAAADHAAYAPDEPGPALRAHAWTAAAHVRDQVRAPMPFARRLRTLLDPRPLLR
jgi:hypothetical protein